MRPRDVVSDADAVRRVLGGCRDDFGILVRRYLPAMEALAYSATGSRQDAEDIVQESFLKAFQGLDHLREPKCFGSWLGTIVKNTAQSFLKRRTHSARPVLHPEARPATPGPTVEQREIHAYLRREIGALDEKYRDVLLLHYFGGVSTGEIANVLNISRSAVLKRLERGRRALGARLVDALGQGLQAQPRRFDERASRAIGLVAGANAPWMTAVNTAGNTGGAYPLAQKLVWAVAEHKAAALGAAVLTAACAVLLVKAWPVSASGDVRDAPLPPRVEDAAVQAVAEPVSAAAPAVEEAAPETPAARHEIPAEPGPAVAARREVPAGYPGRDSAAARRHVVEGIVLDPRGQPLPEASVWAARAGFGPPDTRETLSDGQGRFMFKLPDGKWKVMAAKGTLGGDAGIGPGGVFVVEGRPARVRMVVPMQERSVLRGRLIDKETGEAVGNGSIFADNYRLIRVDESGRFVIEGLRREDHTFLTLCPGYLRRQVLCSTAWSQDTQLEVALRRGAKLAGRVTDGGGRPVAGAWVSLAASGSLGTMQGYYEVCDDQGRFAYEGAPPAREFRIEAMWPCYLNWCGQPMPGTTVWKGAATASETGLNLVLPEGPVQEVRPAYSSPVEAAPAVIHGRVLGPDGQPVRVFHVRLGLTRPSVPGQGYNVHYGEPGALFTSEDGAFALTADAKPGDSARVVASVEGYRDGVVERAVFRPVASARPADALTLRLGSPVSLTVNVIEAGPSRQPVKGARVTLDTPFWDVNREGLQLDKIQNIPTRPRHACTDVRGDALFDDVAFVDGVVRVERDGYAVNGAAWDGRARAVTVTLEPECVLLGEVMSEDGTRPARGEGLVILKGSWDGSFDLDEEGAVFREHCILPEHGGKFRIAGLPPRKYTLELSWQDGRAAQRGYLGGSLEEPVVVMSTAGGNAPGAGGEARHRRYSDMFVLEAGQTLEVSYPGDDVRLNPGRVAAHEGESPADEAVHRGLVGVWERQSVNPNGAQLNEVLCLGEDGALWTGYFVSPVAAMNRRGYVQVHSGTFSVLGGDVHFYDERGSFYWPGPVLVQPNRIQAGKFIYTRNPQGFEYAIQKAQTLSGVSMETDLLPLSELIGLPSL